MSKIINNDNFFLKINDIFYSIQGESSFAGYPCFFVRLAGCNIKCSYCDTKEALTDKNAKLIHTGDIINEIIKYGENIKLVEITGGEPLMQGGVYELMNKLLNLKYTVLLETNGTLSLKNVPDKVVKIMDIKCPSSGYEDYNNYENLNFINKNDELKFVIGSDDDYEFAKNFININKNIIKTEKIIFSAIENQFPSHILAEKILFDRLNVRIGLQLHKILNLK
ncbi:MAG: 7-carboxy-7-deazaguanine synthase QueE [bacterium]